MSKNKFVNTHYPGIVADPNENKGALSEIVSQHFLEQIQCINSDAQKKIFDQSVFIIGTNPLSTMITQRLFEVGLGRVGVFNDQPLTATNQLLLGLNENHKPDEVSVLAELAKQCKQKYPWATFESFNKISIDRRLDDMVRGFNLLICTEVSQFGQEAFALSQKHKANLMLVHSNGYRSSLAFIPSQSICSNCFHYPELPQESLSYFLPLLQTLASKISSMVVELTLGWQPQAHVEITDARVKPWLKESKKIEPLSSCKTCQR